MDKLCALFPFSVDAQKDKLCDQKGLKNPKHTSQAVHRGPSMLYLLVGAYPNPPEQPTGGLAARSVPKRFMASP